MSDIAAKLTTIAENQQKVYDAGYAAGQAAGGDTDATYQQGIADGKQAEHDRFWDAYLNPPTGVGCNYWFAGRSWTDETFRPNKDIIVTGTASMLFAACLITDLQALLDWLGVKLDFSKCTAMSQFLTDSEITRIGVVDTTSASSLNNAFWGARSLHTIEALIFRDNGSQTFSNTTFNNCKSLANINSVAGVIGSSVNFQWSVLLSKASIANIINALSATASGMTLTLSETAVTNAFGSTTADEWTALIATKSNWTISLV